jgi:Cu(I)/Ag(I) efflux system membrane protein CusA/SilA
MVDATIVLVENVHKRLEPLTEVGQPDERTRNETIIHATKEVARPIFFALILITVAFLPVFALEAQEGRLFKPLAFTKTFCMFFSAIVSITLAPALISVFVRGKMISERHHPISRVLIRWYEPVLRFVLHYPLPRTIMAVAILAVTAFPFMRLGHEFMPPLNEGTILYMPTTQPGISITQASQWLQQQDRILRQFPEVETVFGKVGRAETSTDPAPLSMAETIVELQPKKEWPRRMRVKGPWDYLGSTLQGNRPRAGLRRITWKELNSQMDMAIRTRLPGTTNAWVMPIKARTDMLTTGIRTPVGVKILGPDLSVIEKLGHQLEAIFQKVPGTRSAFFESTVGGYYLDITPNRDEAARYGLTVGDVEDAIEMAIGGMNITTTIEGLERYSVNIRYPRELRENIERLKRVLVSARLGPMGMGAQVPLGQLADIRFRMGPPMIRDDDAQLAGYVFVDITSADIGGYVNEAKKAVATSLKLDPGYTLLWTGQYEFMLRVKERMKMLLPITGILIFLLLYFTYGHWVQPVIVLASVPFAATGSVWLLYLLGYNLSIGVWIGFISFGGLAAATGIIMIIYLDEAYERWKREGRLRSIKDVAECVVEGAVQRVRPKMMTVMTMMIGLLPIMWSAGSGADTMKRIAAPMIGGLLTSAVLTLLDIPVFYFMWKSATLAREARALPKESKG